MSGGEKPGSRDDGKRPEEFLQVFKRGIQFTEELLQENERLRGRLVRLEEENRSLAQQQISPRAYEELLEKMTLLEEERSSLLERFHTADGEGEDFKNRYKEIEEENNRLVNLYIASYQLHSTLDLKEVVRISFEIIINLIGSMDFALYINNGDSSLVPVRAEGRPLTSLPPVSSGTGTAGRAAQDKVLYVAGDELTKVSLDEPRVCLPLVVEGKLLGMFMLYSFLAHKECVTELDREMFKLLGGHAAVALYAARLHAEAEPVDQDATSFLRLLND